MDALEKRCHWVMETKALEVAAYTLGRSPGSTWPIGHPVPHGLHQSSSSYEMWFECQRTLKSMHQFTKRK